MDSLPLLANNLAMVHSITRHYARPASLDAFLRKVANQLIRRSREHIMGGGGGKLWDQPRLALLQALADAARLHAAFQQHAVSLLSGKRGGSAGGADAAAPAVDAAGAEAAAEAALAKYGLFVKRCAKLAELFSTAHQFAQLAAHTHIEGVSDVLAKFGQVRRVWPLALPCCSSG